MAENIIYCHRNKKILKKTIYANKKLDRFDLKNNLNNYLKIFEKY